MIINRCLLFRHNNFCLLAYCYIYVLLFPWKTYSHFLSYSAVKPVAFAYQLVKSSFCKLYEYAHGISPSDNCWLGHLVWAMGIILRCIWAIPIPEKKLFVVWCNATVKLGIQWDVSIMACFKPRFLALIGKWLL